MVAPNCASVPAVVARPVTAPVLPLTAVTLASVYVVEILEPFHVPDTTVPSVEFVVTLKLPVLTLPDVCNVPAVNEPVTSPEAELTLPVV